MKASPHILVVDDDGALRTLLALTLEQGGYRVSTAANGRQMMQILKSSAIDLIVLDLMLPDRDGFALCREIRADRNMTPIVILTGRSDQIDRIIGLEMGADDYVVKPVDNRELLARVKAVLRRVSSSAPSEADSLTRVIRFAGWQLDMATRELQRRDGRTVELSSSEFELLITFLRHPQTVLTRDQLLDHTKGRSAVAFDRSIDVLISRLRRKLGEQAKRPQIIKTVWGNGYVFTPAVTTDDSPPAAGKDARERTAPKDKRSA